MTPRIYDVIKEGDLIKLNETMYLVRIVPDEIFPAAKVIELIKIDDSSDKKTLQHFTKVS